jgi:hypothetical protein
VEPLNHGSDSMSTAKHYRSFIAPFVFVLCVLTDWHSAYAQAAIANPIKLAGSWYDPSTSGQGFIIDVEYTSVPFTNIYGSWFTFTLGNSSETSSPLWFTFAGYQSTLTSPVSVDIFYTSGGHFDSLPSAYATRVGEGTLQFSDCTHASFMYSLPGYILNAGDPNALFRGTVYLERLSADPGCPQAQFSPSTRGFSGAWYNHATPGQGFFLDVGPTAGGLLFGGWFTYGDNAVTGQAWYTLQGAFPEGATEADITIYRAKDETFLSAVVPIGGDDKTRQVGTAHIKFTDCNDAEFTYTVAFPNSSPVSGNVPLVRLTPQTVDCLLAIPIPF